MSESFGCYFYQKCYVSIVFSNNVNMGSVYHKRTFKKRKTDGIIFIKKTNILNIPCQVQYPTPTLQ